MRPFPLNRTFRSQSVLSEELREEVWRQVVEEQQTVSTVSAVFGIDMRRVAAVVRLKMVEKDWIAKVCWTFLGLLRSIASNRYTIAGKQAGYPIRLGRPFYASPDQMGHEAKAHTSRVDQRSSSSPLDSPTNLLSYFRIPPLYPCRRSQGLLTNATSRRRENPSP